MTGRAKGVVAAGHRLTAETAAGILREGGAAIDAAIAALAMACVCEPVLCSPGGGGFAMLRDRVSNKTTLIDFFPHTPQERRQVGDTGVCEILADFGTATQTFHIGPATAATPSFFAGLERMHAEGGGMSLSDLFDPAISAARAGLKVTPYQHFLSTVVESILTATPEASALFSPGGKMIPAGETFFNPGLANALEVLAKEGMAKSAIGAQIVKQQASSGHLTAQDLRKYSVLTADPVCAAVGAAKVHLNPLPAASGSLIAHSLAHLETSDPVDMARALFATGEARRAAQGDLATLKSVPLRQRGTTHVSVIDADGNACAVTVSNGEGNGELVGPFGFMLNNILGEEDVNPNGIIGWPLDARLSSMMCPAVIEYEDGSIVALGSGGSNRIRSAIFQIIVHLCQRGLTLQEAIAEPRLHLEKGHLDFEDLFGPGTREELCALFQDHRAWPEYNMFFGGVHAVQMSAEGMFTGTGDTRRDGVAIVAG